LPIRRLGLSGGVSEEIKGAYFPFPSLEPIIDEQWYSHLIEGERFV
jgi:hypothetical protein